MHTELVRIESTSVINKGTYLLKTFAPKIAAEAKPGQFCNIKVNDQPFPLLRRPFSICEVEGDYLFFMFDIHGEGTKMLARKQKGDTLDVLGPLGNGFDFSGDFDSAVLVAGGLGAAPFPFLITKLHGKNIRSYVGGRNSDLIIDYKFENLSVATDDGSAGFRGTVVDLLKKDFAENNLKNARIFACGPNPMLKALQAFCIQENLDCQLSVETSMACGFGICQGCPIDSYDGEKYYLVCKDGPIFNAKDIRL